MVLPLLGGLVGSAMAGSVGLSPLIASALGTGIGAFAETGELDTALNAGLSAGIGGAMLGPAASRMMGGMAGGAGAAGAAGAGAAGAAGAGAAALPANHWANAARGAGGGGLGGILSGGIGGLVNSPAFPGYVGALAGAASIPAGHDLGGDDDEGPSFSRAPGRAMRARPNRGRGETDYGVPSNYGLGRLARGGDVGGAMPAPGDMPPRMNEREIISGAIDAIMGTHPNPEMALGMFVRTFGEDALMDLVAEMRRGNMTSGPADGQVRGSGDGMEDMVPARIEGGGDAVLSRDEFVVPADVVSDIGNGSSEAGHQKLYEMLEGVREARRGMSREPREIDSDRVMMRAMA